MVVSKRHDRNHGGSLGTEEHAAKKIILSVMLRVVSASVFQLLSYGTTEATTAQRNTVRKNIILTVMLRVLTASVFQLLSNGTTEAAPARRNTDPAILSGRSVSQVIVCHE